MYVAREAEAEFATLDRLYNLVAMVGPRQAGKTTLLRELQPKANSNYLLFDELDVRNLFNDDVKKFETLYLQESELTVLDEVHYGKEAGSKLKYFVDAGHRLWVTASSEILMSKEVLSYLVGRVGVLRLYPFSLTEFLAAKKQKVWNTQILERNIWEHLTYGGYPKVVTTSGPGHKQRLLANLFETILLKDVATTFAIEDLSDLERLLEYLAASPGRLLAYERMGNDLNLSFPTLKKYLAALEQSYLIYTLRPYFTNRAKELVKQPKIYFMDTGLRNAVASSFPTEPEGRVFENYLLCELLKLGYNPRYWRTKAKAEVDFIVEREQELIPIEAKLNAVPGRIDRSLRSFINTYRPQRAFVVYYKGQPGTMQVNTCRVAFVDGAEFRRVLGPSPIPRGIV